MLRYYPIDDDLYGLSEIEPVKSLQKAINALLCEYIDEINQKLYTPVAVGPGVRQHSLEWGKGARWQMNNPMTDFRLVESQSNATAYFNATYSALVAAMMNALGETSLGVSNIDRFQADKTATEVKQLTVQRNARDNFNQIFLSEALERQTRLWYAMNQKMVFSDPKKKYYVIRIVGKDAIRYFETIGLNRQSLTDSSKAYLQNHPELPASNLETPVYPVNIGTDEEPKLVPKFSVSPGASVGQLYVEPTDLLGNFDFVADVKSMATAASDQEKSSRDKAVMVLMTNPNVSALLGQEQIKPKFKDLFVSWLEDSGFKDADRFFERTAPQGPPGAPPGAGMPPGAGPPPGGPPPTPKIPGRPNMLAGTPTAPGPQTYPQAMGGSPGAGITLVRKATPNF